MQTFSINQTPCEFYHVNEIGIEQLAEVLNQELIDYYYPRFCTFDIETTSYFEEDKSHAFMYIWMLNLCGHYNIYGRTWDSLNELFNNIIYLMARGSKMVVYVHYLPFEFQFMRDWFDVSDVFLTEKRKPLKFTLKNRFEFRCSYKLSNMGLAKFIANTPNAKFNKQSGDDFDYSKIRTPHTPLSTDEYKYCFCDIAGLNEAIVHLMNFYGDDVTTIPMTSTGYVRRDARNAFRSNPSNTVRFLELDIAQYLLLRTSRRGGNSHCNPIYAAETLENMRSRDMSSAYPAVMIQCKFPMTKFVEQLPYCDTNGLLFNKDWAYIFEITFHNIRLKNVCTIPYIPCAKCTEYQNIKPDNGRVLSADVLGICLTDIDYHIIENQYTWDYYELNLSYASRYGYLWNEYRNFIQQSYIKKCDLKGGDPYLYNKEKNKINALYGMMLTDIVHKEEIYVPNSPEPYITEHPDIPSGLVRYYRNPKSFVHYAHGVWVTAHCRRRLQNGIDALGEQIVYCDTDSLKYMDTKHDENEALFSSLNEQIDNETDDCGISTNYENEYGKFTLGHWEEDGDYKQFKSLGAKKYCYIDSDDNFSITVAGLGKNTGRKYIMAHGGIEAFTPDTIIPPEHSGRTASIFNDVVIPYYITLNKEEIEIRSNIAIKNVAYTFGITQDYADLIDELHSIYH